VSKKIYSQADYPTDEDRRRRENLPHNPKGEPVGPFTGRCHKCGSADLWDDNAHYGCNTCGATFLG